MVFGRSVVVVDEEAANSFPSSHFRSRAFVLSEFSIVSQFLHVQGQLLTTLDTKSFDNP